MDDWPVYCRLPTGTRLCLMAIFGAGASWDSVHSRPVPHYALRDNNLNLTEIESVDRPIGSRQCFQRKRLRIEPIGRSHGLLTGLLFSRALNRFVPLDLCAARGKD